VVLAIVVIAAMVALLAWAGALATSGVGAEDANPKAGAGSAIVHDDAGKVSRYSYPLPHGKVANPNAAGVGSAVIHDDPGNVHPD
jgi:hypothetical protein